MIVAIMSIITVYVLLRLYISAMQIGYVNRAKRMEPVLMGAAAYVKAGNYSVAKEKVAMIAILIEYAMYLVWLDGGIRWLDHLSMTLDAPMKSIFMVLGFLLIGMLVNLPLSIYEKFVLDEKFGFNRSSVGLYVKDTLITMLIIMIIGALVIWIVELIMSSGALWWVWTFLFLMGVIIAINMLFPTIRALFFDKVTPLQDSGLNEKIETMMNRTGFVSSGVFVSDASKRDARLNAYFGGLGKTKRVVLFDTLLDKLTHQELLAVLGHELGHFAHGDIYKNIAITGAMLFGMLAIFGNLPDTLFLALGVSSNSYGVQMILFLLFMPLVSFFMMPFMGMVSRHNEFEADQMGSELGGRLYLANALKKLVEENKSFPLSHAIYIFFYYTHPPVIERLKALGYHEETSNDYAAHQEPCEADID